MSEYDRLKDQKDEILKRGKLTWYNWPAKAGFALFMAFLCTTKKNNGDKEFSAKKAWAFYFCSLVSLNYTWLLISAETHWTAVLTLQGVDSAVIVTLVGALNTLAFGALAVYGWAKAKGAA